MRIGESGIFVRTGIAQESAHAFRANMQESGAGGSVGGAAIATELQARGLAEYGRELIEKITGIPLPSLQVVMQTPRPSVGYTPSQKDPYELEMYNLPLGIDGIPLPYDEMIDQYLDRKKIKERYRTMLRTNTTIIDIAHFYVEAAVRGAILEELFQEEDFQNARDKIIQVTHFHSSPDFTIRADTPQYHESNKASWERRMYEIATLQTSIVQFSTVREREMTARAYDGVHGLTYNYIMSHSIVAGLPINSEAFTKGDPQENRKRARELLNLPENATVFGMVTRVDTEKGYDIFLEHFITFLKEQIDAGVNIDDLPYAVVVGGIPEKDPKLRARAEEIQQLIGNQPEVIRSRIRFSGKAMPAHEAMPAFDAYFGASATETLHLAPKEAGLLGIPPFLSKIAAHIETHPGGSAFLFDRNLYNGTWKVVQGQWTYLAGFYDAFTFAMDPQLRQQLGELNRQNSQRFSLQESTETFLRELFACHLRLHPENQILQ